MRIATAAMAPRASGSLSSDNGPVDIEVPRDREGDFEPVFVRKGQRRVTGMDEKILALYARGQSNRNIVESFKELYDADISASLVSKGHRPRYRAGQSGPNLLFAERLRVVAKTVIYVERLTLYDVCSKLATYSFYTA